MATERMYLSCTESFTHEKEVNMQIGGSKLVYTVEMTGKKGKITKRRIFLKPYKVFVGTSKKDVPKGEWGNTRSPLSNIWLELKSNYDNFEEEVGLVRFEKITDHKLIKLLNQEEFIIDFETNTPIKISTWEKFKLLFINFKIKK